MFQPPSNDDGLMAIVVDWALRFLFGLAGGLVVIIGYAWRLGGQQARMEGKIERALEEAEESAKRMDRMEERLDRLVKHEEFAAFEARFQHQINNLLTLFTALQQAVTGYIRRD